MKTLPGTMQADLESGVTTHCFCWKITRQDGVIQGFTEHDEGLAFDGVTYLASSSFRASEIASALGLSVDNLEAEGALSSDTLNAADLDAGLYDDAAVQLFRVDWRNTDHRVMMLNGSIGEVKRLNNAFTAEVRSLSHKLNQTIGRQHSRLCDTEFGSARCGANAATFTSTSSVSLSIENRILTIAAPSPARDSGYFSDGLLKFTSGQNNGVSYEIKRHSESAGVIAIELWEAARRPVANGDRVSLVAGCNKTFETCRVKFSNGINFQGFPYIPGNDTLVEYPTNESGQYDGGSLYDTR